jgi:hypothetical protein
MNKKNYEEYNNITVAKTIGRYTDYYHQFHDFAFLDYYRALFSNLIRFSFFKVSPLFMRKIIYDDGKYFLASEKFRTNSRVYSYSTIDNYTSLYYLSEITGITDNVNNHFTIVVNNLPHEPAFFELPDYKPSKIPENRGEGPFNSEDHYHVNMASFMLLGKCFYFLKENNVYNNTRIIIVSDHGRDIGSPFPDNIILPNGKYLETYAALLMVKDFGSEFELARDNGFMTVADVPHIAAAGFVNNLINPFNGRELVMDKNNGAIITSSEAWEPEKMLKYRYDIKSSEWLHVKDNIFDPANWSLLNIEE